MEPSVLLLVCWSLALTIDCTVWLCERVCLPTCLFAAVHESRVNWQLLLCVGEHKEYFTANFWIFFIIFFAVPPGTVRAYPVSHTLRCPLSKKKREQNPVRCIGADPLVSHFNTFLFLFLLFFVL